MVDLAMAARHLDLLDDSGVYTFQTFLEADPDTEVTSTDSSYHPFGLGHIQPKGPWSAPCHRQSRL